MKKGTFLLVAALSFCLILIPTIFFTANKGKARFTGDPATLKMEFGGEELEEGLQEDVAPLYEPFRNAFYNWFWWVIKQFKGYAGRTALVSIEQDPTLLAAYRIVARPEEELVKKASSKETHKRLARGLAREIEGRLVLAGAKHGRETSTLQKILINTYVRLIRTDHRLWEELRDKNIIPAHMLQDIALEYHRVYAMEQHYRPLLGVDGTPYWRMDMNEYIATYGMPEVQQGILNLEGLPITDLAGVERIHNIHRVVILNLNNTALLGLSPEIARFRALEQLNLSDSLLEELPEEMGQLANLRYLFLRNLRLRRLPGSLRRLRVLTAIDMSNTDVRSFPVVLLALGQLEVIDLTHTMLQTVPSAIVQLERLSGLRLADTQLSELPNEISRLSGLRGLDIRHTPLSRKMERVAELQALLPDVTILQ